MIYLCRILPILRRLKHYNLHPVYFFNNRASASGNLHLLVQHGADFCGFVSFEKEKQEVYAWVLYETKAPLTTHFLQQVTEQQDWLQQSFKSVVIVDYTGRNTWVPQTLATNETETLLLQLMTGSSVQTVTLQDTTGDAVNLYRVATDSYQALNNQFAGAVWKHYETLMFSSTPSEQALIVAEVWFNTLFIFAQQEGKWLLLQQRQYQTPEDVLYHLLNCKQQWNMGDDVIVRLQGMVEEQSALYQLLHQYILHLEIQQQLVFSYPANTSDIPNHTKQLIDRILTCVS